MIRSTVVLGNIATWPQEHGAEFCQYHNYGDKLFVAHSVYQMGVIKFVGPEGHRFVVLDDICSHLIAGSVSINVKWFIVVRISKKSVLGHNCFHSFEGKFYFVSPEKHFLSRLN